MAVVGAGVAVVFAAATAPFATGALVTAVSVRGVSTMLWCFWYYSAAVIVLF